MARHEYRQVTLMTVEGIEEAERLKEKGWKIASHSPMSIRFYREVDEVARRKYYKIKKILDDRHYGFYERKIERKLINRR